MNKHMHLSIFILASAFCFPACTHPIAETFLNHDQLATKYFGADTAFLTTQPDSMITTFNDQPSNIFISVMSLHQ